MVSRWFSKKLESAPNPVDTQLTKLEKIGEGTYGVVCCDLSRLPMLVGRAALNLLESRPRSGNVDETIRKMMRYML